jgi:hypothetical protein
MAKGKRPPAKKAPAGTSHHPLAGQEIVEYVPQEHQVSLEREIADELPEGLPRSVFLRSVAELGDRVRDTDLEALRLMAWALHRSNEAQRDVEDHGMFENTIYGRRPNPALKVARDEANLYLKIADQYALTFVSRLRAGIMQLAGQSMLQQIHESMASAIVARIVAADAVDVAEVVENMCTDCGRSFATRRGLSVHRARAHR